MRTLAVNTFLTLDGVMQAPGGPDEDTRGGFAHGGWSVDYWDDELMQHMTAAMAGPFDLLLGRITYEIFAAHWPRAGDDPMAVKLNTTRKYVASRTLSDVSWQNSMLLRGDVAAAVAELKRQDGPELQVHGSGNLIQTLLRHDLVDELRLRIFPLVLGTGQRLFADGTVPANLEVVESSTSSRGVIMVTYRRAGDITYGSFALDAPEATQDHA